MKTHSWKKLPDTFEDGVGKIKHWECKRCGCEKNLGMYIGATPDYCRSGQIFSRYTPVCVEMGRRSNEPLD